MSLQSLLSIARTALLAHQRAMSVTAHNVANANTPGFSRQRIELRAATPLWTPLGALGRGVDAVGVSRSRDRLLDEGFRRESGLLGRSGMLGDMLTQIEDAFQEPSDHGVASALDGMFRAFSDLANDPSGRTPRELVRQSAQRLVDRIRGLDRRLVELERDAVERLRGSIDEVNDLTRQIADLNRAIVGAGGAAGESADLLDRRDALLDRLAAYGAVRTLARADGSVSVLFGDALIVDGGVARTLEVRALAGGGFGAALAGGGPVDPMSGGLAALVDVNAVRVPALRAQLDTFTAALVAEINAVHRTGYTPAGATGTDFFDPAGVRAGTLALAAPIAASGDAIAAGGTTGAGDNPVALALAGLANAAVGALGGRTLREHFVGVAAQVGFDARSAATDTEAQLAMVDRAQALRLSVSGVSVDEEMVALIAQQQAYGAAARLVRVADEMMQDLLRAF